MKKVISVLVATVMFAAFSISIFGKTLPSVGYLLVGPKNDGGWSMRHEQGFQSLTKYGYKVFGIEMAPEAEAAKLLGKLARKNDIVFATSFGYMDGMAKAAEKHPDTVFMHATGYKGNDTNFDNYGCMSYQARYLTGIAAGMMTKTNKIGVVGSYPIPEIVRNINALTLGAQSVNPDIEVNVIWINSWFDPPKDMDAANALLEGGNDILYTTTDSPSVVVVAQKAWKRDGKEVWSMGNDAPMGENGPDRYITGMMFHWSGLYQQLVSEVANGTWTPNRRLNLGLKQNCVALSPWGVNVPGKVVNTVETIKTAWLDDELDDFYPFSAGVTKRDGTGVPPNTIKRGELDTMNYFVQGVVGSL
jgi:basic membrane protein A|tara:strand:+ start:493 stop:1572 length:1080 start_codon:yes stop_codon:yes gene_type:complete